MVAVVVVMFVSVVMLVVMFVSVVMLVVMLMVVRMFVVMNMGLTRPAAGHVVAVLLHAVGQHGHVQAPHAAFFGGLHAHLHAGDGVHHLQEFLPPLLGQQVQQSGGEHVPRRAHVAFQIQRFHAVSPPSPCG